MRLFQMELYKICRKKILWLLGGVMIAWMCICFSSEIIAPKRTVIENKTYHGYEAIQKDREITTEYTGVLTDGDVAEIVEKYGLPTGVRVYAGWEPVNYLTGFITDNLTDAFIRDWNEFHLPTQISPIASSPIREFADRGAIAFGYAEGWKDFFEFFNLGVEMIMVWLIIALAPVFSEEKQQKMYPLIFTSENGKSRDVTAKLAAAIGLSSVVYLIFLIVCMVVFHQVFGIFDVNMPVGVVLGYSAYWSVTAKSVTEFFVIMAGTSWVAVVLCAAISIWVSAMAKSVFSSVLIALLLFVAPPVLNLTLRAPVIYFFASAGPCMRVMHACLIETWRFYGLHMLADGVLLFGCIFLGSSRWRKVEVF